MSTHQRFDPDPELPEAPAVPALRGETRSPARRRRARVIWRLAGWLLGLLVLAAFAAWFVLPAVVKLQTERWLAQQLARPVSIARLRFDPLTLAADLENLRIGKREGDGALLSIRAAHVDLAWQGLRDGTLIVERLQVDRPVLSVERYRDGSFDIDDLLRRWRTEPGAAALPLPWPARFSIANIELDDGSILFDDARVGQKHRVEALALKIPLVSNLAVRGTIDVEPALSALVNGARFEATGQVLPFSSEPSSTLTLDIGTSEIARYVDYLPFRLPWTVASAHAAARIILAFTQPREQAPTVQVSGGLTLAELELRSNDGTARFALPGASVDLLEYAPQAARLRIGEVLLVAPRLDWREGAAPGLPAAWRERLGELRATGLDWSIAHLELSDGRFDLARGASSGQPLALGAKQVTLRADAISSHGTATSHFHLSARSDANEAIELDGRFSHDPVLVSGRFDLRGAQLPRWTGLLVERLPLSVRRGVLDMAGGFEYGRREAGPASETAPDNALPLHLLAWRTRLADLRLEPLVDGAIRRVQTLEALSAEGLALDFAQRQLGFARLRASGLKLNGVRTADGTLDLATLLASESDEMPAVGAGQAGGAPPHAGLAPASRRLVVARGWTIDPGELSLSDALARIEDRQRGAASHQLQIDSFVLGPRGADGFGTVALRGRLDQGANIAMDGRFAVDPLRISAALETRGLALAAWREAVDFSPALQLEDASLTAQGELVFEAGPDDDPGHFSWNGAASLSDLRVASVATGARLLEAALVSSETISIEDRPWRIATDALAVQGLRARLDISPGGAFGLAALARDDPTIVPLSALRPEAAEAAQPGNASAARIAQLHLVEGVIDIDDRREPGAPSLGLRALGGRITAIGGEAANEFELEARLSAGGRLAAQGRYVPATDAGALSFKARLDAIPARTLAPWSRHYLGWPVAAGSLDAQLDYQIAGQRLEARHEIVLHDLVPEPGDAGAGQSASELALALALWRDRDGAVRLSMPVSGSLAGGLRIGERLARQFEQSVEHAAAAPFVALGESVGSSADELERLEFEPGSARLTARTTGRLATLARALAARPQLRLGVAALADDAQDRPALARHQFERMLKARKQRDQGRETSNLDAVVITRSEYPVLVEALFADARLLLPAGRGQGKDELSLTEKAQALIATLPVGDSQLLELADARARAVSGWLAGKGGIDTSRIETDDSRVVPASGHGGARVGFRLSGPAPELAAIGKSP